MQQVHCNGSKCAKLKQQKEKPVNTNSTQKFLLGLKLNYFQELEWETVEFVQLKRNSGMLVTYEPIKYKAWEPAESHNIRQHYFSDSTGWCVHSMQRNRFTVCRASFFHTLPAGFKETLVTFQHHVIRLHRKNSYLLSQRGNANETPLYFDVSSNCTVSDGAKSVVIKISGCEKMHVTVMWVVLADGSELPPL